MKMLAPISITEAMLTSTSLPEADYATWAAGTTYALGTRVIKAHKVWASAQSGNLGHDPVADTTHTWWNEVGPTNRWAMFDGSVSTTSADTTVIEVVITPGVIVEGLAIIAGIGDTVRVQMHDGATSVYDETQSLDSTPIDDWDDYFFADTVLSGELLFEGLPAFLSASITVTITAASGTAEVGALVLGRLHELGETQSSASAGITDYSRKETDDFGNTRLVQRTFAKRCQLRLVVENDQLRRVLAVLAGLRGTPSVCIGEDDTDTFSPLVMLGWIKSFSLDIQGEGFTYCTLEFEGLT